MFSERWEGGDAVTLSSLSLVNSGLSDVEEGEFTFLKQKEPRWCRHHVVLALEIPVSVKRNIFHICHAVKGFPRQHFCHRFASGPLLTSSFFFLLNSSGIH